MPVAYNQEKLFRNFFAWYGTSFRDVLGSRLYHVSTLLFLGGGIAVYLTVPVDTDVTELEEVVLYAIGFIGSLFIFQVTWYINTCYSRFYTSWLVSCKGMARLNDLSLQVFAYLSYDPHLSLEVMRLMHAANHLLYIDMTSFFRWDLLERRHLLTEKECEYLNSTTASKWFQCCCWSLQLIGGEVQSGRLVPTLGLAMDRTICEWRQNTTHHGDIAKTPVPFGYYHLMITELVVVKLLLALRLWEFCIRNSTILLGMEICRAVGAALTYLVCTLVIEAMMMTAVNLSFAWGYDEDALPAEEFIFIPFMNSRTIFAEGRIDKVKTTDAAGRTRITDKVSDKTRSIFLRPLHEEDVEFCAHMATHSGWAQQKKLNAHMFRHLDRQDSTQSEELDKMQHDTSLSITKKNSLSVIRLVKKDSPPRKSSMFSSIDVKTVTFSEGENDEPPSSEDVSQVTQEEAGDELEVLPSVTIVNQRPRQEMKLEDADIAVPGRVVSGHLAVPGRHVAVPGRGGSGHRVTTS
eukprot:TRINITY_DN21379_c0_g1_i1.p1 TRINITY_DN21379_c0_g1~~TRINITY_DN21379_c0_g1_i1.p1  ORF type:complete len:540 (-),score=55.85 TRINITY_DN21379_c0_g1_i1:89-1645(-)